MFASQPLPCRR
ncbi:hypothetical protein E2C01_084122 [Portunus trituberculatus]|uniref:Uncharacterized protein n=1 Tax=Portunus trituberculatus TaxID=210409 RepID=A0A5B7J5G7_PORTR|nr:hypothetical protein [Portunus trituberculatus]